MICKSFNLNHSNTGQQDNSKLLSTNFDKLSVGVGCVSSIKRYWDFGGYPDYNADSEIFLKRTYLRNTGNFKNFADNSKRCWRIVMKIFGRLYFSLPTSHLIFFVLILSRCGSRNFNGSFTTAGLGPCYSLIVRDQLTRRRFELSECF